MKINQNKIILAPLLPNDFYLFEIWLDKDYIFKWFCPNGVLEKEDWYNEVKNSNGSFNHMKHFIVLYDNIKIGFCFYFDLHFEQDYTQKQYNIFVEKNNAFEIGYLIGEEEYLRKGIGKIIIQKLEEKILEIGGKEIFADPLAGNIPSIKTLLSNGFVKINDQDYRKKLI